MSGWKIVVHWLLPPPLILTVLILFPQPQVVKKGLLQFTKNFLFVRLAGEVRLVHMALIVTGAAFAASAVQTYQISQAHVPDTLTPNQKTAVLARRWREERNFWIACLTFLLWGMLYRFYALALEQVATRDRVVYLEALLAKLPGGGGAAALGPGGGAGAGGKAGAGQGKGQGVEAALAAKEVVSAGGKGGPAVPEPSAPPLPVGAMEMEGKKAK